jgi:transcriptional regulator with XRE-family HTH domain
MTTSLVAESSHPLGATIIGRRSYPVASERVTGNVLRNWRNPMAAVTGPLDRSGNRAGESFLPASRPGVIGGAVIKAARRSAGLSRRRLASMLAVGPGIVRNWENGTCPLFCMGYHQLRRLAAALDQAGAKLGCDVGELVLTSRCDLLVTGMLQGFEDYAEVPPVDEEGAEAEAARALLRWALTGVAPERCRPYASAGPLLAAQDLIAFTALARNLCTGSHGDQLASYGVALAALTMG